MKHPIILDDIINKKHSKVQRDYFKTKIRFMKPVVDSKCPDSFYFMQNRFNQTQKNSSKQ